MIHIPVPKTVNAVFSYESNSQTSTRLRRASSLSLSNVHKGARMSLNSDSTGPYNAIRTFFPYFFLHIMFL